MRKLLLLGLIAAATSAAHVHSDAAGIAAYSSMVSEPSPPVPVPPAPPPRPTVPAPLRPKPKIVPQPQPPQPYYRRRWFRR